MCKYAPQCARTKLQNDLGQLYPQEHPPRRYARGQYLVPVIPPALVRLHDQAASALTIERRPTMGRDIHRVDLIGVVCQELSQPSIEVTIRFLLKPDHMRDL